MTRRSLIVVVLVRSSGSHDKETAMSSNLMAEGFNSGMQSARGADSIVLFFVTGGVIQKSAMAWRDASECALCAQTPFHSICQLDLVEKGRNGWLISILC